MLHDSGSVPNTMLPTICGPVVAERAVLHDRPEDREAMRTTVRSPVRNRPNVGDYQPSSAIQPIGWCLTRSNTCTITQNITDRCSKPKPMFWFSR
jgi:hypothetical protein